MLLTIFKEIPDRRRAQARQYDLSHILLFSVFAILSGADSYRTIETFIKANFKILKKRFKLKWKQAPSYSTIRDVIKGTNSEETEKAFRKHSLKLSKLDLKTRQYVFISMDGKTIRGSFDNFKDQKAIQIFSAFLTSKDIILAHEKIINRKTNEIPTAQKMINELNLKNCKAVFTFDAMHCQKKTLETVIKSGNNAIVQVKENQKKLLKDCEKSVKDIGKPNDKYIEKCKKQRNRIEGRNVEIFENPKKYFNQEIKQKWGKYIKVVIKVERRRKEFSAKDKRWKISSEISYYVSTINLKNKLTAKEYGNAIRNHWGIENRNHCVRDVSLNEDKSRIRINPDNFVRLRSFALNILRTNNIKNVKNTLYQNALNFNNLLEYYGLLF